MIPPRKKRNSSKVNLVISAVFHSIIIAALFYFAAREGLLGKQLKKIAITMTPKEKPAEKPKEPEAKPEEPPKVEEAPKMAQPASVTPPLSAPPPAIATAPAVAPPATALPSFEFGGGKVVETSSNPHAIYKRQVENALRSRWNRPEDIADESYVAEVEVEIDSTGAISASEWKHGSGDARWDNSVKKAIAGTTTVGHAPPKGFPSRFLVRFDVQNATEPLLQ